MWMLKGSAIFRGLRLFKSWRFLEEIRYLCVQQWVLNMRRYSKFLET